MVLIYKVNLLIGRHVNEPIILEFKIFCVCIQFPRCILFLTKVLSILDVHNCSFEQGASSRKLPKINYILSINLAHVRKLTDNYWFSKSLEIKYAFLLKNILILFNELICVFYTQVKWIWISFVSLWQSNLNKRQFFKLRTLFFFEV